MAPADNTYAEPDMAAQEPKGTVNSYAYAMSGENGQNRHGMVGVPPSSHPEGSHYMDPQLPASVHPWKAQQNRGNSQETGWQHGLFRGLTKPELCCLTCWCPCVTAGRLIETTSQKEHTCLPAGLIYLALMLALGCCCPFSACNRTAMRKKFGIHGDSLNDHCIHCCCEPCALCQEYLELEDRGLDPKLGAHQISNRVGPQEMSAAPPAQQMAK